MILETSNSSINIYTNTQTIKNELIKVHREQTNSKTKETDLFKVVEMGGCECTLSALKAFKHIYAYCHKNQN